jgi:para-aminobenzoate synthetase
MGADVNLLIVDNYDSFTYNLVHLASEVFGTSPAVVKNDADWSSVVGLRFDAAIISPGPGHPERARDFGISRRVLTECDVPTLGVCLGHQGICSVLGGRLVHAPEPMHGRIGDIHHDGRGLFEGLQNPFQAVRYHSFVCAEPLPETLSRTAWTADGLVMGLAHRTRKLWGVQFHPESICTRHGRDLMNNFRAMAS